MRIIHDVSASPPDSSHHRRLISFDVMCAESTQHTKLEARTRAFHKQALIMQKCSVHRDANVTDFTGPEKIRKMGLKLMTSTIL